MRDVAALCHEFFALPEADKAAFYSEDNDKTNRYFSGSTYETGGDKYWIDCLRLGCTIPVGSSTRDWPDKPNNFRQVVEKFAVQTRSMGMELLRLLAEGMGLRTDYFDGDLGGTDVILGINHYPACPDPTTMIGLPPHCDRNLLTLLLPNKVPGLQLLHNGECVHVEPLPNAFVVHTGLTLEDSCVLPISIYEADNPRIYNFILHVLLRVKIDVADLSKSILRWRAYVPIIFLHFHTLV
uniref:Uncharacterized protein n=1 Tax=Avena sativa TaxID=4498 RepID=A0ACD5Y7Y3_AVESA